MAAGAAVAAGAVGGEGLAAGAAVAGLQWLQGAGL